MKGKKTLRTHVYLVHIYKYMHAKIWSIWILWALQVSCPRANPWTHIEHPMCSMCVCVRIHAHTPTYTPTHLTNRKTQDNTSASGLLIYNPLRPILQLGLYPRNREKTACGALQHRRHLIIRVGAGLIQFVYRSPRRILPWPSRRSSSTRFYFHHFCGRVNPWVVVLILPKANELTRYICTGAHLAPPTIVFVSEIHRA